MKCIIAQWLRISVIEFYLLTLAAQPGPPVHYAAEVDDMNSEYVEEAEPEPQQPQQQEIRTFFPETWLWDLHEVG